PHKLTQLQHELMRHGIFSPEDVKAFANVWYSVKRDHSVTDNRQMNAILDNVVCRWGECPEEEREDVRGKLSAFRNLYAFLSQIIPYQDSELEKFYTFVRHLLLKLPPPNTGETFMLDDEVALKYYRIQQMTDGSIDLRHGEADPLKGPTDVGTGMVREDPVPLSTLVQKLNERFGTDFTEADQLFFDQIRATAEEDEKIVEAAKANNLTNFSAFLERMLDDLFIERMEGNEEIFSRVMTDKSFRTAAHEHLAHEIFLRVRGKEYIREFEA
ncbi:MAG: type I restriction endonuclease subunit R, partial [Opitutales bacterium]